LSNINIRRAVENIRSGTTVYTPVIELIVNAIQAIRAVRPTGGQVTVTILRSTQGDLIDKIPPVDGFMVEDDGIRSTLCTANSSWPKEVRDLDGSRASSISSA
jgi:hypothetical protein